MIRSQSIKIGFLISSMIVSIFLFVGVMTIGATPAFSSETLKISCSAQIYEALNGDGLQAFTDKTGIKVKVEIRSSGMAIKRLMDGQCDIAASAQSLNPDQKAEGLSELNFAKDPIIVIVNPYSLINNLTSEQVRNIFFKNITNAGQVGGRDIPLTVIAPDPDTALYGNFVSMFLNGQDLSYDIATTQSTYVKSLTRRIKGGISFVNQAATNPKIGRPVATKRVKIDGLRSDSEDYPYFTVFSLVTKGEPTGAARQFVDFIFSDDFAKVIKAHGMTPCPCPE